MPERARGFGVPGPPGGGLPAAGAGLSHPSQADQQHCIYTQQLTENSHTAKLLMVAGKDLLYE